MCFASFCPQMRQDRFPQFFLFLSRIYSQSRFLSQQVLPDVSNRKQVFYFAHDFVAGGWEALCGSFFSHGGSGQWGWGSVIGDAAGLGVPDASPTLAAGGSATCLLVASPALRSQGLARPMSWLLPSEQGFWGVRSVPPARSQWPFPAWSGSRPVPSPLHCRSKQSHVCPRSKAGT